MKKFKLVVVAGEERATEEFDNVVYGMVNARRKAKELLDYWVKERLYPDSYVEVYDYREDIKYPSGNYPVFMFSDEGTLIKRMMKIGTYTRVGIYDENADFKICI